MLKKRVSEYLDAFGEIEGSIDFEPESLKKLLRGIESDTILLSSDKALLRGYLAYHYPEVLDNVDFEKEFEKVLESDPANILARQYLGFVYFDKGEYKQALFNFEKVDLEKLFTWANIKISELIVSCHLELNNIEKAYELLIPVLEKALQCETDDYALPTELLNSLANSRSKLLDRIGIENYTELVDLLNTVLNRHDLSDIFEDQMKNIELGFS